MEDVCDFGVCRPAYLPTNSPPPNNPRHLSRMQWPHSRKNRKHDEINLCDPAVMGCVCALLLNLFYREPAHATHSDSSQSPSPRFNLDVTQLTPFFTPTTSPHRASHPALTAAFAPVSRLVIWDFRHSVYIDRCTRALSTVSTRMVAPCRRLPWTRPQAGKD